MKRPYLLDTNIVSKLMKQDLPVLTRVARVPRRLIGMSVISVLELEFGLEHAGQPEPLVERYARVRKTVPLRPLPDGLAAHYARVRNELEKRGTPIGALDLVIAAHAMADGAVLVTNNSKEFSRVKGLRVEDWSK